MILFLFFGCLVVSIFLLMFLFLFILVLLLSLLFFTVSGFEIHSSAGEVRAGSLNNDNL